MTLRHGQAVASMVVVTWLGATAGVVTRQLERAQAFAMGGTLRGWEPCWPI